MAPIYFFRENESAGFLCQWYISWFQTGNGEQAFNCAEQYMMYHKALTFGDEDIAKRILLTKSPRQQKGLGRKVANFDAKKWDEVCMDIVTEGNYHKFMHPMPGSEDLKPQLLATGDQPLVEASKFDRIWGIGYAIEDAHANRDNWGENRLGKCLEAVRTRIRSEEAAKGSEKS